MSEIKGCMNCGNISCPNNKKRDCAGCGRYISPEDKIKEYEAQIEKMKCGGNCKYEYWINTGGCYDQKCRFTGLDCTNCKDKWEIK